MRFVETSERDIRPQYVSHFNPYDTKMANVYSLKGDMTNCSKNNFLIIPRFFSLFTKPNKAALKSPPALFVLSNKLNLLLRENIGNNVTALFLKIVLSTLTGAFQSTNQTKTFARFDIWQF